MSEMKQSPNGLPPTQLRLAIRAYLKTRGAVSWPSMSWTIIKEDRRILAEKWLMSVIEDIYAITRDGELDENELEMKALRLRQEKENGDRERGRGSQGARNA